MIIMQATSVSESYFRGILEEDVNIANAFVPLFLSIEE